MNSPIPSSSQAQDSQSILIPESPGSPNILDPPSPDLLEPPVTWSEDARPADAEVVIGNHEESNSYSSSTINYEGNSSSSVILQRNIITDDSNSLHTINYESNEIQSNHDESSNLQSNPIIKDEVEEPPTKVRRISSPKSSKDDSDGETCPICLDLWSNSGEHRLVALKCGHLFGYRCIEKWLKGQSVKDRSCPSCKSRAHIKDLRFIYARKLVAADTSEITAMQQQLEIVQSEKSRMELELQKSKIAHKSCLQQLENLRNTLMKSHQVIIDKTLKKNWRFSLEKNIEICKDGGCRVMAYNCRTYELYVSQKSSNSLFPGYGIRRVSCIDHKLGQFVHLHPKPIRDITYSQPKDLLLSVGLDSCARIVERGIPVSTIQAGMPLWSCSWDYIRDNEFYVGGVGGHVLQYDIRNSNSFVQRLSAPGDMSPVASLCSTEHGLLSCHFNSSWLWVQNESSQWEPRALPVEGPFMSLNYDHESQKALISCRPGVNSSDRSRLILCSLKASSGDVSCNVEQTFCGSARTSILSRTAWVKCSGASWIAAHSESDSSLFMHGLEGVRSISLPANEPALDIKSVQLNGDTLLAALSECRLRVYKAASYS